MFKFDASTARAMTNDTLLAKDLSYAQNILDNIYVDISIAAQKGESIVKNIFDSNFHVSKPITNNVKKTVIENLERMGYSIVPINDKFEKDLTGNKVSVIW
jgi:hypothetical protein